MIFSSSGAQSILKKAEKKFYESEKYKKFMERLSKIQEKFSKIALRGLLGSYCKNEKKDLDDYLLKKKEDIYDNVKLQKNLKLQNCLENFSFIYNHIREFADKMIKDENTSEFRDLQKCIDDNITNWKKFSNKELEENFIKCYEDMVTGFDEGFKNLVIQSNEILDKIRNQML